ncbi:MAG TPA: preprotein translocase subunit SecE [Actinobacteria bacterium]|nr:preprotein translocase subunit SecE [Actinomycetota bacterium]
MSAKKKKSGKKIGGYFRDVKAELKKVSWPTRKEVISSTIVVLFIVLIFSVFIGCIDYIFILILKLISA